MAANENINERKKAVIEEMPEETAKRPMKCNIWLAIQWLFINENLI